MKLWAVSLVLFLPACTADVFASDDAGDPPNDDAGAFVAPPHLGRLLAPDSGAGTDAGPDCAAPALLAQPYCGGVCATPDGGETCGNGSNTACVAAHGFFAECSGHDCDSGQVCALASGDLAGTCPPTLAGGTWGATLTCADKSYFGVNASARVVCRADSECTAMADAGTKCVVRAVVGFPALAGVSVGVCE